MEGRSLISRRWGKKKEARTHKPVSQLLRLSKTFFRAVRAAAAAGSRFEARDDVRLARFFGNFGVAASVLVSQTPRGMKGVSERCNEPF